MNRISQDKLRLAGLGELLWDIFGDKKHIGGAPANFALHVQQLGHIGIILSRVGKDVDGKELLNELHHRGLSTEGIQIDPNKPTGRVTVSLDDKGRPQFLCSSDVAFDYLDSLSDFSEKNGTWDALLFGTLAQRNPTSRTTIQELLVKRPAKWMIFDANLRDHHKHTEEIIRFSMEHCDILKLNEIELRRMATLLGKDLRNEVSFCDWLLHEFSLKVVCVTLGEFGSFALRGDEVAYSPGFKVPVVDTTGAGDAFIAGFAISLLENKSLEQCLEFGNGVAAWISTQMGATPVYSDQEVKRLLASECSRNENSRIRRQCEELR